MASPLEAHLSETLTSLKFATKVRQTIHDYVREEMLILPGPQHSYWYGEEVNQDSWERIVDGFEYETAFVRILFPALDGGGLSSPIIIAV